MSQVILCLDESCNILAIYDKLKLNLNHYGVGDIYSFLSQRVCQGRL